MLPVCSPRNWAPVPRRAGHEGEAGPTVVCATILHNQLQVFPEFLPRGIQALADVLAQRLQVHGLRDDLVIIFHHLPINRLVERVRLPGKGGQTEGEG